MSYGKADPPSSSAKPHLAIRNPSEWIIRFTPLVREGGPVLDLAAGGGRHGRYFLERGYPVTLVDRQTEAGYDEVSCSLPAVVSVTAGVVEPRYPSFKGIMAAKSKPVETVTAADLGVTPVGWEGSGQAVASVEQAPAREAGTIIEDDGESFGKIVEYLETIKVI